MGAYRQMQETFISEYKERSQPYKDRIIKWSAEAPITRIDKPTNIARARELGYKAKQGVVMARVRVLGGKKMRPQVSGGRKPSKSGRYFSRRKSSQAIAEERVAKKFTNCEILNSYFVGEAGANKFYEVILLDKTSPVVLSDPQYRDIVAQNRRAERGLTRSGRKHRGLMTSGFGAEKFRPSKRRHDRS
jgi:large subunit ribosomal protein L15e